MTGLIKGTGTSQAVLGKQASAGLGEGTVGEGTVAEGAVGEGTVAEGTVGAERRRAVSWEDPLAGAALSLQLSGLDYLRKIVDGQVPPPPIAALMGMRLEEVEPGRAVFSLDVGEHLYNPIGSVHGGAFCTVLDSAMGCAVHSALPAGKSYTTLELKVNLVKALTVQTPTVRSEGRVISSGRRVATASAQIVGPDGTLFAHATTTCLIFDVPGPQTGA